MCGTSIVSEWHSVSFRILLSVSSTASSMFLSAVISATGWAEVARSMAKGTLCQQWVARMEPIQMEAIHMEANGQMEGSTSLDEYTMGRRSPCCIYCVMSSSECKGSCPGA